MAVTVDVHGIEALADKLRGIGDDAPKAVLRALKRTQTTILTRIARIVAQASGVPVRRLRQSLHASKPTYGDPNLTWTLWGGRTAIVQYNLGVQQSGALPPSAFRARMPSSHIGFFERRPGQASFKKYPGRAVSKRVRPGVWHTLPIDEVYGPPFTAFLAGNALSTILAEAGEVFRKNLAHEIEFRESQRAA